MKRIFALGSFDGLHIGHMAVLAGATHCLLFDEHPQVLLGGELPPLLLTEQSRDELLRAMGVEPVVLPFKELRGLSPKSFVEEILVRRLGAGELRCGYNFRFGAGAAGNAETLGGLCAAAGIGCTVIPPVEWGGAAVSATRIRECLLAGEIDEANAMLGRAFGYRLPVLHGEARGRLLGYPTANQLFPRGFIVPRRGVYATRVRLGGKLRRAMTNIGLRPSFGGQSLLSETHIFGYTGDLYGKELQVELLRFLRDERSFASPAELCEQLKLDAALCGE